MTTKIGGKRDEGGKGEGNKKHMAGARLCIRFPSSCRSPLGNCSRDSGERTRRRSYTASNSNSIPPPIFPSYPPSSLPLHSFLGYTSEAAARTRRVCVCVCSRAQVYLYFYYIHKSCVSLARNLVSNIAPPPIVLIETCKARLGARSRSESESRGRLSPRIAFAKRGYFLIFSSWCFLYFSVSIAPEARALLSARESRSG